MTREALHRTAAEGVQYLVLNDGPNALNPQLMSALSGALRDLRDDGAPPVLLTSSHPRVFCPGWDLKRLANAERPEVADFLAHFNRLVFDLFSYPAPTAAAIGGHAVAGGCLLAMCCDLRVMSTGPARIGLSELNLGVPVPASSLTMLRQRLAPNLVEELVVGGDGLPAERARRRGFLHRTDDPGRVVATTARELGRLAAKSAGFAATKRFLLADAWARMAKAEPEDDKTFLACWFSPETQQRIADIAERLGTSA